MHAGKRWTHAATRPMRENPISENVRWEQWDSGGLRQDHFEMTHLMRNVSFTLSSGWRRAPSAGVLHRHVHHAARPDLTRFAQKPK